MTDTDVVRRFNRTYTQRIGALDESFLGLGLPAGSRPAGVRDRQRAAGPTARDLRVRLGLDSGHLARQLRSLEERGLVDVRPDPADRRRRVVTLTRSGRALRRRLDDRSEQLAARLVEPLTERQRARLTEALATADLLVRAATVELLEVDPRSPVARSAVGQYFAELDARFPTRFDVAAAEADDLADPDLHAVRFLVATSDGEPVACGGVRELEPGVGEIKRMWVHDDWRGAGLGARLLRRLEDLSPRDGAPCGPARHQRHADRGDRDVRARRLPTDRALQRQPLRPGVLREGPRESPRRGAVRLGVPKPDREVAAHAKRTGGAVRRRPDLFPPRRVRRRGRRTLHQVYNAQHEELLEEVAPAFEEETGIEVKLRNGKDLELANQLVQEGDASPADVFLTENSPAMSLVDSAGLFAPLDQETLT